ncbi:hypothetical protein GCK72_015517 [Caenorhabditis remanei]|uniref:Uncharacterized protein n=1 Tax=Caenorhabditis remanei TaxID=31234 RepID=A0A6A5GV68_CAERE|nr:hypothetical protein GCK72_015517 [Caenorhabditis remanei]KAF1759057.1 hypothetical protein GCK72_015517 [Caenorhabditis remanei]
MLTALADDLLESTCCIVAPGPELTAVNLSDVTIFPMFRRRCCLCHCCRRRPVSVQSHTIDIVNSSS